MYGDTWVCGVDLVAVRRAVCDPGPCPDLRPQEQAQAIVDMAAAGQSDLTIAVRLGMSERTVYRWRTARTGDVS